MSTPTPADIIVGNTITFQSKAVDDTNFYYGIVIGMVTSEIASKYADITTYNNNVQAADNNVPEVSLQDFLLIKLIEHVDDSTKYIIPFSTDWINPTSLTIVATKNITILRVFDVNSANVQNVINLLATAGFQAKVDSFI